MLLPLDERRLYYDLSGPESGPVVCLTHSPSSDSGMWAEQVPALLAAGFRVLRIDMRGHGGSDSVGATTRWISSPRMSPRSSRRSASRSFTISDCRSAA
jgi:pimeloyl-ACP methyl ester carboxylesterase